MPGSGVGLNDLLGCSRPYLLAVTAGLPRPPTHEEAARQEAGAKRREEKRWTLACQARLAAPCDAPLF